MSTAVMERKTLELIEQIEDETDGRLPPPTAHRLGYLRGIAVAGGSLTTAERVEVSELWDRYVK